MSTKGAAKIVRADSPDHRLKIIGDAGDGEIFLVRGGIHRAYLWIGHKDAVVTITGGTVLRKLAMEILKELDGKP